MKALRYILGAGAQGRVVLETWRAQDAACDYAFLDDDPALTGRSVLGAIIIGPLATLREVPGEAILAVGDNPRRLQLAEAWTAEGAAWGIAMHPSAVVSPSATVGAGSVILPRAVVHTDARIGAHVIVNTGAIIEHDSVIEDGASVSPGVCTGGRVHVGRGAFIGAGATLAPRVTIGAGSVIGAGAVVVADIPPGVLAHGVPARVIRPLEPDFDWRRLL